MQHEIAKMFKYQNNVSFNNTNNNSNKINRYHDIYLALYPISHDVLALFPRHYLPALAAPINPLTLRLRRAPPVLHLHLLTAVMPQIPVY